ncbi:MAG: hypothetical protein Ta2B_28070 [Termitinemataceae bacterium]|nr:MAG: hypothetical protein Ta2B_28070 [Termitinemataceae bacterium]
MIKNVIINSNPYGLSVGGVESYTAHIYKYFDEKYKLYLFPSANVLKTDLQYYTKYNFNINLKNKIFPATCFTKGLYIGVSHNADPPKSKPAIHIVHFPERKQFKRKRFRKNLFLLFAEFLKNKEEVNMDKKYRSAYSYYLCNSKFTASYFKESYPDIAANKIKVVYPPVKLFENILRPRKPQIVVFSRMTVDKKIDILINTFCTIFSKTDVKLFVMGAANTDSEIQYLDCLKKIIDNGINIEFCTNPDRSKVAEILSESRIFWHAKGFGEYNPHMFEHFGITTVEVMSAGLIPIVIDKGGQKEIVDHKINGFKWDTINCLVKYTKYVLEFSDERFTEMSLRASEKARLFSEEHFQNSFGKIIQELGHI